MSGIVSPEAKQTALGQIVEEVDRFKEGTVSRLHTNQEWADLLGLSRNMVKKILRGGLTDETLAPTLKLRKNQIQKQIGSIAGTNSYLGGFGAFGMKAEDLSRIRSATGQRLHKEGKGIHGMTADQRLEAGKKGAARAAELGAGFHGVDPETGEKYAVIGGRKSRELGVGVHGRSSEQKSLDGIKGSEVVDSRKILYQENYYDSYYEAATASLMEKYIPGFVVRRGETYQITNGIHKKIDFFVKGVFLEFQPILLSKTEGSLGAFETEEEFNAYNSRLARLSPGQVREYKARWVEELKQRYYKKRRAALDENPEFKDKELIVAVDANDLYDSVIERFGTNIPTKKAFRGEFNHLRRAISIENRTKANDVSPVT